MSCIASSGIGEVVFERFPRRSQCLQGDKGHEGESHHGVIPNVNRIGDLREIWRHLSGDEKKLFDTVARSYLASVMPDYRYRQTIVTLDVRGFGSEAAQVLPVLRDREVARLREPKIEDKETRPPRG